MLHPMPEVPFVAFSIALPFFSRSPIFPEKEPVLHGKQVLFC